MFVREIIDFVFLFSKERERFISLILFFFFFFFSLNGSGAYPPPPGIGGGCQLESFVQKISRLLRRTEFEYGDFHTRAASLTGRCFSRLVREGGEHEAVTARHFHSTLSTGVGVRANPAYARQLCGHRLDHQPYRRA